MPLPATAIAEEVVTERDYVGLRMPLPRLAVSPVRSAPVLLGYTVARLSCNMADLHPGPGYIGALAILSAGPAEVEIRGAEEVLGG